jgi:ribosome biogenesis ATPase
MEEEEEEEVSLKMEDTLQLMTTTSSSTSVLVSAPKSNRKVSAEEKERDVKEKKKGSMFKDLGGMKEILEELITILVPLFNPKLRRELGVKPIGGILLHGVPGCGKTRLAHAIAYEIGYNFYPTSATALVSGVSGKYLFSI